MVSRRIWEQYREEMKRSLMGRWGETYTETYYAHVMIALHHDATACHASSTSSPKP